MTRWYSPQLKRELVSKLYFRAKAEGVAMTTLVNRIVQTALDAEEVVEKRRDTGSDLSGLHSTGDRSGEPVDRHSASR
jgi:hypothetical protein